MSIQTLLSYQVLLTNLPRRGSNQRMDGYECIHKQKEYSKVIQRPAMELPEYDIHWLYATTLSRPDLHHKKYTQ